MLTLSVNWVVGFKRLQDILRVTAAQVYISAVKHNIVPAGNTNENICKYLVLEVIVNVNSPPPKRTVDGVKQTYPPTTAEEKLARKNELKERGSSSSDSEVSTCSKACVKSYETLKEHYDNLTKDFNKSQLNVGAYKTGLESVEAILDVYKNNEKFEKGEKEIDDLKLTLEKFGNSSKNLSKLLDIHVSDKFKTGVRFDGQVVDSHVLDSQENERYKTNERYHAVPPPYTRNFMPLKYDLVLADEEEYVFMMRMRMRMSLNLNREKPSFAKIEFVKSNEHVKTPKESVKKVENKKQAKYPRKNSQSLRVAGVDIFVTVMPFS
ncbi:hypothetical protein Tco_0654911 [Tanacetum coccineum]|uniref:Uncharacterized protein n=1 Tax=Tanacetum coccineum TaxID=301880 RepID=A0ABQ4X4V7_9ASTR